MISHEYRQRITFGFCVQLIALNEITPIPKRNRNDTSVRVDYFRILRLYQNKLVIIGMV